MRRLLILAAVTALTMARPEQYKEQEDFKYSRSSSDEGSKSGFYGAQRGNMGGNYERAHNMDSLAQHQMSGAVNQVEGELGDGAKAKTGSVYTAANTRGIYGSGHYDLSNLAGRNFQESASFGNSQSQASSSQSSSGYNNAAYTHSRTHNSGYGGYQAAGLPGQSYETGNLQALDNTQSATSYGQQASSGYHSQSGYNSHTSYDKSDANTHSGTYDGSNVRTRLVSAVPVRIVFRPGTRVAIPVGAETYDINQGALVYDAANQRSSSYDANQRSSSYDHSSVNSEAEALSGINRNNAYKPGDGAKHYESSYSYRKEWERHNTLPPTSSMVTENPLPQNSELYEDSQLRGNHQYEGVATGSQTAHASGYNANVKSSASESRYRSSNLQQHQLSSGTNSNAYTQAGYNTGLNGDLNSQVESINSQTPKTYQSSYSYHKSWERQGDPYVIKPASNGYYDGQSSQRLSAGTKSASYGSGSHHQSQIDCDEICGHSRVARSYDAAQYQEELGQQAQNLEDFGQQSQNLEDFGQQSQNLEDFGQQSQKLENFGQQTQDLQDVGQQTQQNTWGKLQDLGQQSKWDKLEDLGQQVQNKWDQPNQNTWERAEDLGQQTQHNPEHNSQDIWDKMETTPQKDDQQTQNTWDLTNTNDGDQQITQYQNQEIDLHAPPHNEWNQQQSQFNKFSSISPWDKLNTNTMHNGDYNAQTMQNNLHDYNNRQQIQSIYGHNGNVDTNGYTLNNRQELSTDNYQSHTQHDSALFNLWNKLDTIQQQLEASSNKSLDEQYNSSSEYTRSQNSFETSRQEQTYHRQGRVNTTNSYQHHFAPSVNMYDDSTNKTININNVSSVDNYDKMRPQDIGRGDIGPEDLSDVDATEKALNYLDINKKPLIPVVVGDLKMNKTDQENVGSSNSQSSLIPNLPASIFNNHNTEQNVSLQNTEQSFEVLGKETETFGQQNLESLGQKTESTRHLDAEEKYLKNQEIDYLGLQNKHQLHVQNEIIPQQNSQTFGQNYSNLQKNNTRNFAHEDVGLLNENSEQQNTPNLYQLDKNLDQQSIQDLGQQLENMEQQNLQNFSQQDMHLEQHNDFGQQNVQDFRLHNENMEQHNLQDFGQQNENLEQQTVEDLRQKNKNMEQQNLQDFGQQNEQSPDQVNENLDQQNVQDFGQQNENVEQQNVQDFGQQNTQDFGQKNENLEQQNVQNVGQVTENLNQQNLQDFGQQNENLEQQNVQDFGQQNTQDFGQQNENLNQQNLQDFGQQNQNMEQQNVQDFGQQNTQDFGQQNQNMEQQNVQDFGQQNTQDFGQNENLEQQNVQDFGQQNENLEQQNIRDFGQQNVHDFGDTHFEHQGLNFNYKPWNYGQQNLEQENQQNYDLQQESVGHGRENFNQNGFDKFEQVIDNFEQHQSNNREPLQNVGQIETDLRPRPEKMEVLPVETPQNIHLQSALPKTPVIEPLPEPETEKPGFWKSVGNKFVNAKDKVFSWFGS